MKNIKILIAIIAVIVLTACSKTTRSLIDTNHGKASQVDETKNLHLAIFDDPNFERGYYNFGTKNSKSKVQFRATYGIYHTEHQSFDLCIKQYEHIEGGLPLIQYSVSLITEDRVEDLQEHGKITVAYQIIDKYLESMHENFSDANSDAYILLSRHLDHLFAKYQEIDKLKYESRSNLENHDEYIKNNLLLLNNSPPPIRSIH